MIHSLDSELENAEIFETGAGGFAKGFPLGVSCPQSHFSSSKDVFRCSIHALLCTSKERADLLR